MEPRREQVFVGIFVIIAASLLLVTIFSLSGLLATTTRSFHAKFSNVAGLEPGATVRYEGGPRVGRVEKLTIDSLNPTLLDMEFSVSKEIPVKTDSRVAILSFSPLGDNHLELKAGSPKAPQAPDGAILPSDPYVGFNDLTAEINRIAPQAQDLLGNLNDRVTQLKITIDRINELLNDKNRQNISGTLSDLHGMLQEDRPQIKNTLDRVSSASEKVGPLLDQLHNTIGQIDGALKKVDGMLGDNREDIRASVIKLRESLERVSALTAQLQLTLENNDANIQELLNNMRIISQNLKEFTDTIKTRPSTLIYPSGPKDRKPGDKP